MIIAKRDLALTCLFQRPWDSIPLGRIRVSLTLTLIIFLLRNDAFITRPNSDCLNKILKRQLDHVGEIGGVYNAIDFVVQDLYVIV